MAETYAGSRSRRCEAVGEFFAVCSQTHKGSVLTVTPDAAAWLMRLTGGHVVPAMCRSAGIDDTAATDNVYLALCGRIIGMKLASRLAIEASDYAAERGEDCR